MTAKYIKLFLITIITLLPTQHTFANQTYKMSIEEVTVINDTSIQASVYIENLTDNLVITSYQCALSIYQEIDFSNLTLSYLEESSELLNEPNLYIGIDNIDGPTELTFVSFIGNDIIKKKTRVGTFILSGKIDITDINLLNIQWDFEGTICTIITGEDFVNITNPDSHESIFESDEQKEMVKLIVEDCLASDFSGQFADSLLFDGICSSTVGEYSSSTEGRWAVNGFPQWITIDLGKETTVNHLMLDPFGSEDGISYDCEFYYGTYENKVLISKETTQVDSLWSKHELGNIRTRYITMIVTGSVGNSWCDFWEMEVYGYSEMTDVDNDEIEEETVTEELIPEEYSISQNYPNPFNPTTTVEVRMKESGSARIDVYNVLGERVLSIFDGQLNAGVHQVNIDGSRLASGMYIYQLIVDNQFSDVKKMNLMK